MRKIGRFWAGKLFGTNTGNLAAELDSTDSTIKGVIRFMDDRWGPVVFSVAGTFDGSIAELKGQATQAPENVTTGEITIKAALSPDGSLRGQWSSTLGTGGNFILFPHDVPTQNQTIPGALPEQLHSAVRTFGAVRLYADDVRELIAFLKRDFNQGRIVVTFRERGNEISKYANEFENDIARLGVLRYLKLQIQEPEAYGINRLTIIELNATGSNEIRVQGIQESWVIGKAEALSAVLREREKFLSTTLNKYGLNANGFLFIAALILLPELSIPRRFIFMIFVFIMIAGITYLHSWFIPNALIRLSAAKPTLLERIRPQMISWLLTVSAGIVGAIVYGLLKGEISFPAWLSNLMHSG
jgi:hypothetical protein